MADVKLSALPSATTPLSGAELLYLGQSGASKQVTVDQLAEYVNSVSLIRSRYLYEDDFIMVPNTSGTLWDTQVSTGTVSGQTISGRPGIVRLNSSTSSTGYAAIARTFSASAAVSGEGIAVGGGPIVWQAAIRLSSIAVEGAEVDVRMGLIDELSGAPSNGIYVSARLSTHGGNYWGGTVMNSSTPTVNCNTNVAIVGGQWVIAEFRVNDDGSQIDYYVDGVLCGTITTSIPTIALTLGFQVANVNGAPNKNLDIDWMRITQVFTTQR